MISYAQNGEDVVLDRVLPLDRGFYVDIGASSPDASSVTRHFYEKGWSGINIEPRRDAWEDLKRRRPRDLNLPIAVGAEDGMTTLYSVVEDPDLSTIDPDDLAFLTSKGYTYESLDVEVRSLDSILAVAGVTHIDFLKIDAEGAEEDILRGLDLTRWRPRVIVVEAIRPWSRDRTDHEWRGILESKGYKEGLFDGVNLFFAPIETPEVFADLVPASPLDHYQTAEVVALREAIEFLQGRPVARPPKPPPRVRVEAAPPFTRFAVVGSPHSGGDWVATALARTLDADLIRADHPAAVPWDELPERAVVLGAWCRTAGLTRRMEAAGMRIVSPGRHPFEVLAEAYPGEPAAGGFLVWARSERARQLVGATAEWWSTPAAVRVRYEDLQADPAGALDALLVELRLDRPPDAVWPPGPPPPPAPVELGEEQLVALEDCYHDVAVRLGYPAKLAR